MAVRGHFASQGTVAGGKNGYGAQQIELGFLVGGASDAEPLQHIRVPGPKKQASRCSMVSPSMAERRSASLTLKSLSSFNFC